MAEEGKETEKEPPATVPAVSVAVAVAVAVVEEAVAVVEEIVAVVVKKPFTRRTRQSATHEQRAGESLALDGELRIGGGNWHASSNNSNNTAGGDPTLAALEREHEEVTKVKNIERIYIGQWEVEAWYYSPYPEEYAYEEQLFICGFCLQEKIPISPLPHCIGTCVNMRKEVTKVKNIERIYIGQWEVEAW
eukprot:CAMPEP_0194126422 /NCGR_PEP_ID=MMETSP0150-20130528/59979_1 /TAXON_ID=122233 /ORGANISM="Chaetoceros debilis, Strain MM31A-1" /LENGTH=190 /DNA_ID=CAMNT_0038820281 /DNA_START=8 /DNA_END=577 /DNA_ORIENTATION=-